MKICHVKLESVTPYSQSGKHETPRVEKEQEDAYARRTWQAFLHINQAGQVIIPPAAVNKSIQTAASYLRLKIPGKGQSEYQKHFLGGMTCHQDGIEIGRPDDFFCERLFLNADGKRGGNKRVWRYYPTIASWSGEADFFIFDERLLDRIGGPEDPTVFEKVLEEAGSFIGLGRFRAEKGGFYGRFRVVQSTWNHSPKS